MVTPAVPMVAGLARRFAGHLERLDGEAATVVWRASTTVEPAVRMAVALHAEASVEGARVGVAAVSDPADLAPAGALRPTALHLAQILGMLAPRGVTLLSAPPQTIPSSVRCVVYGSLHPVPTGEPVSVSRVVDVALAPRRGRALVVGRETEMAEFRRLIAKVVSSGKGVIVHVRGEAGIGKSCLMGELRRVATEHGFAVYQTFHREHAVGRARSAVAMLLQSLLMASGSSPALVAAALDRAVAEGRLDAEHLPFARDLLDLPMGIEERRLFDAMESTTRHAGHAEVLRASIRGVAAGPLLVEVEDVHWASEESRSLLGLVATRALDAPLVLVTSSRLADDPIDASWPRRVGGPSIVRWELDHLASSDAQAMAAAILSRRRMPWMLSTSRYVDSEAVLRCVERSGGHPLMLEQMLLGLEAGIDPRGPAPISALVTARLATLAPGDRRAIELASVYGARFDVATISAALQVPWEPGAAVTAGLVMLDGREHRFAHALVRDAIHAGLTDAVRRRFHRALARVLHEPGLRAEHLERAGDPGAAAAWLEAAREEDGAGRSGIAMSQIERGLAAAPDDAVRFSLLALAGRIHADRGRPMEALTSFEQALVVAPTPIDRCRALLGLVSALRLQSRQGDAEALLSEAEGLATAHGQEELVALAAYYRGCLLFARGDVDGCMTQHAEAVRHARAAGQPRTEALALSGLGDAYYARSRIGQALEVIRQCVELSRAHGFGRIEVANLYMVGALRALENDTEAGVHDCLEAVRMAARVGNRRAEMLAALNAGICLTVRGETTAALEWIAKANHIAEAMDTRGFLGVIYAFEARARILGGERELGLERAREALALARDGNMRFFGGLALGALARATDAVQERERALDEGEQVLSEPCMSHNYFYFYDDAIEVWCSLDRWDRLDRCAAALDAVDAAAPIGRCRVLAARARALARLGRDPQDEAARELGRVVLAEVIAANLRPLRAALDRALGHARPHGEAQA